MTSARILHLVLIATLFVGSEYGNNGDTPTDSSVLISMLDGGRFELSSDLNAASTNMDTTGSISPVR